MLWAALQPYLDFANMVSHDLSGLAFPALQVFCSTFKPQFLEGLGHVEHLVLTLSLECAAAGVQMSVARVVSVP
jgi:hypothetical protein